MFTYFYDLDGNKKSSSHTGIIIGVSVGCAVLVLLTFCAGLYAFRQRKMAKRAGHSSNPFGKISFS